jgi:ParB family chromosome partitioning protein
MAATDRDWATLPVRMIDVGLIDPHPLNPRGEIRPEECKDITDSITGTGAIFQPLLVVPNGLRYTTIIGHRRRLGAIAAGLDKVPCIVTNLTIEAQMDAMLVENLARKALTPAQEAVGYCRRLGYDPNEVHRGRQWKGISQLARRIGQTQTTISTRLAILKLPHDLRALFSSGDRQLSVHMAPLLAEITDETEQRRIALMAARRRLTIEQLRKHVKNSGKGAENNAGDQPVAIENAPRLPPTGRSRADVFAAVAEVTETSLRFEQVQTAATLTCETCGIYRQSPEACKSCPLVDMLTSLIKQDLNRTEPTRDAQS